MELDELFGDHGALGVHQLKGGTHLAFVGGKISGLKIPAANPDCLAGTVERFVHLDVGAVSRKGLERVGDGVLKLGEGLGGVQAWAGLGCRFVGDDWSGFSGVGLKLQCSATSHSGVGGQPDGAVERGHFLSLFSGKR